MDSVRLALNTIHSFFVSVLGLTVIDVLSISQLDFLKHVDGKMKTVFMVVGFIYYLVAIFHKYKMNKFKRRERKLEIWRKEMELKNDMDKQDLRIHKKEIGFEDPK